MRLAVIGDGAGAAPSPTGAEAPARAGCSRAEPPQPPAPPPHRPPPPPPRHRRTRPLRSAGRRAAPAPAAEPNGDGVGPVGALADGAQAPGRERDQRVGGDGHRVRRADHPGGRARVIECRRWPRGVPPAPAAPTPAPHQPAPAQPWLPRHRLRPCRAPPAPSGLDGVVPPRRGPGRAVLQHAAPHGRAHGAVQGDLAPRLHRQRGRLRERRARARRLGRALQGRGGLHAHLPAVRGPGRRRGAARLPAPQRVGGRRLAAGARRGQPRHRGRPRPRGPDRPGHPPGRGGHAARDRPAHPRPGRAGPQPAAQRRRHRRRHLLHHQRRALRHLLHGADHQPAAGGHPGHRRHRPPARSW